MPSFAVLYDPESECWLRFANPLAEIEIHDLEAVPQTLASIEKRVETEGLFAAGFVSYEAAPAFDEALQTHRTDDFPLLRFGLYAKAEQFNLPDPDAPFVKPGWQAADTRSAFSDKVDAIRAAIARGETYQVNLTFPLTSSFPHDPWQFFLHLVQGEQPRQCGFLQSDRWAICSASPVLFFSRSGNLLTMRPMKGTAPRGRTLEEDRQLALRLQQSDKNRAENIMILDMVRNDLGRLAPPGEVCTEAICALEKYPTVWQLTSTVTARCEGSMADIFQALFPCASITGAPKARTMQIIRQAESCPRRIYTGTFGWIAPKRRAHFSVAIRTVLVDRKSTQATYGVGAGITWGSNGPEEYQECMDKAAVLSNPKSAFALIETLRWTPQYGYFVLEEHLTRLQRSAEYFDFAFTRENVSKALDKATMPLNAAHRVRLLLFRNGQLEVTTRPLEPTPANIAEIRLADEPVDSKNILLYHKTTQRDLYERALAEWPDADEVVLWNERGEITECCTANLVIAKDGQLITPPLASGLLPGTYREYLLRKGIIRERVIEKTDLQNCSRIYLVNAVRKWRRARLSL